jgi:hypothetical protein
MSKKQSCQEKAQRNGNSKKRCAGKKVVGNSRKPLRRERGVVFLHPLSLVSHVSLPVPWVLCSILFSLGVGGIPCWIKCSLMQLMCSMPSIIVPAHHVTALDPIYNFRQQLINYQSNWGCEFSERIQPPAGTEGNSCQNSMRIAARIEWTIIRALFHALCQNQPSMKQRNLSCWISHIRDVN